MAATIWDGACDCQVRDAVAYEVSGERYERVAAQVHQILPGMGYGCRSKGVCWLSVEEVRSIVLGPEAGARLA